MIAGAPSPCDHLLSSLFFAPAEPGRKAYKIGRHASKHETPRRTTSMYRIRQENLPFVGSSHEFVGAEHGDVNVSVFLLSALPGKGPGPHRHPYDEIQFVREGRGVWTVNGKTFEGSAGDIFVIKAGEIHEFKAIGDGPLVQVDVHLSPRFIQENLA
jgi:quercetin dioxygenase-like cupin family protein